jgi:hypothetical protein
MEGKSLSVRCHQSKIIIKDGIPVEKRIMVTTYPLSNPAKKGALRSLQAIANDNPDLASGINALIAQEQSKPGRTIDKWHEENVEITPQMARSLA